VSNANPPNQIAAGTCGAIHGPDTSGGSRAADGPNHHPHPPPCDYHNDLHNSFHWPKINILHYDSRSDPLPWLNHCESYFRGTQTMAREQIWMASLHMDDVVTEWYYALQREYALMTWARFVEFINLQFGTSLCSNHLGELKELCRTSSVEDYQCQFMVLLCCCDGLSAIHAMNMFKADLSEPMTSDVEMQQPVDLQAAMNLPRVFKQRVSVAVQIPTSHY
jgi:hypothetical protein